MTPNESPNVLADGAWRFDPWRRVQVWVETPGAQRVEEVDLSELLACPTCHARVDQTCRTKSGHRTTPHGNRIVPRQCKCGRALAPRKRFCDECRAETRRSTKRAWDQRRKAAERARPEVEYVASVTRIATRFAVASKRREAS